MVYTRPRYNTLFEFWSSQLSDSGKSVVPFPTISKLNLRKIGIWPSLLFVFLMLSTHVFSSIILSSNKKKKCWVYSILHCSCSHAFQLWWWLHIFPSASQASIPACSQSSTLALLTPGQQEYPESWCHHIKVIVLTAAKGEEHSDVRCPSPPWFYGVLEVMQKMLCHHRATPLETLVCLVILLACSVLASSLPVSYLPSVLKISTLNKKK